MINSQTDLELQATYLIEDRIHPAYRVLPHERRRRHRKIRRQARR